MICVVIEDEFTMNSGYRGFSSVEVGVRAVGRARRVNNGMSISEAKEQEVQDTTFTIRDLDNILGVFGMSSADEPQVVQQSNSLDNRIQQQQQLSTEAYTLMLEQQSNAILSEYKSKQQQQHYYSNLSAASWGALDIRSSSIITQAIETRSVVERLRLGLAMILDSQMTPGGSGG